jgi:hypothetical protein
MPTTFGTTPRFTLGTATVALGVAVGLGFGGAVIVAVTVTVCCGAAIWPESPPQATARPGGYDHDKADTEDPHLSATPSDANGQPIEGIRQSHALASENCRLVKDLVKKARSLGFLTILATQKSTGESIPTSIRDACPVLYRSRRPPHRGRRRPRGRSRRT